MSAKGKSKGNSTTKSHKVKCKERHSDSIQFRLPRIPKKHHSDITQRIFHVAGTVIPITFCGVPSLVREVWQYIRSHESAGFKKLDTRENYEVFLKCVLVLCQAKLVYTLNKCRDEGYLGLPLCDLMAEEETRSAMVNMAGTLPLPIAVLLDSIGVTTFCGQKLVPVIATLKYNEELSGTINFLPEHINRFVRKLKNGVVKKGLEHTLAKRLEVLTDIKWEAAHPAKSGIECPEGSNSFVKLTNKSYMSLRYRKWVNKKQMALFKTICLTVQDKSFIKKCDIMSGHGTRTQLVQLRNCTSDHTVDIYVMEGTARNFLSLAPALCLGLHNHEIKEVSRYLGSPETAVRRGKCNLDRKRKLLCSEHYMLLLGEDCPAPGLRMLSAFCPITFRNIPAFVRKVWIMMSHISETRFRRCVTKQNYEIFLKCILVMCQAKLVCAHQAGRIEGDCFNLMHKTDLSFVTSMASNLPKPIANMLDNIGITSISYQHVVPVIAKLKHNPELSGAINFLPADINVLVDKLRNGVVKGGLEHKYGKRLKVLAGVKWEKLRRKGNPTPVRLIRLQETSYNSLRYPENWITEGDRQLFKDICDTFYPAMQVYDFKPGQGAQSQLVQFVSWKPDDTVSFYMMDDVPEDQLRPAAAFGFGYHEFEVQPTSRFVGSPQTAYKSGVCRQGKASSLIVSLLSDIKSASKVLP